MRKEYSVTGVPIPAAVQRLEGVHAPQLVKWDYCKIDDAGAVEEAHCKMCGIRILGPRPWGDPIMRKKFDEAGTVLLTQHMRVMPFNTFEQFILEMQDGSAHVTTACKDCALKAINSKDQDLLQALHASDMASLAESARTHREMQAVEYHTNRIAINARKEHS